MNNIATSMAPLAATSTRRFLSARGPRGWLAICVLMCAALLVHPGAARAAPADAMIKKVKFNDVKGVTQLLDAGIDPNMLDNQGTPMLVLAAREKSGDVARLLVNNPKTNIEQLDAAGENAMMLAALNGDKGLVQLLIDKGAEVNKKGWTPLHYAATNGNDEIVKLLLDNSAYIDAGSPNGTTPMMMAARGGHITTVKLLLDEGADPTIKNQLGLTAISFAQQNNETEIADGLTARIRNMQQPSSAPGNQPAASQNGAK
jgi:ankyrin repeat protein